jgi:triacylglycerol lipase
MAYDAALAVTLGRHVQQAYALYRAGDPPGFVPYGGYTLVDKIYADDGRGAYPARTVYGYVAQNPQPPHDLVFAFRGTEDVIEWIRDFEFAHAAYVGCDPAAKLVCEDGFTSIYETCGPAILSTFAAAVAARGPVPVYVTGHSLGAALATLLAFDLGCRTASAQIPGLTPPVVYTFASPLVGDKAFATAYGGLVPESYRIANEPDLVPKMPPPVMGYEHVNTLVPIDTDGDARHSLLCWHSLATYLHALDADIPLDSNCSK